MGYDPSGQKWWHCVFSGIAVTIGLFLVSTGGGAPIGTALISAGVNSLINGYINEASGGSFDAGYGGGAVTGFIGGLFAGYGGSLLLKASNIVGGGFNVLGLFFGGIGSGMIGGALGGGVGSIITDWIDNKSIDWQKAKQNAVLYGALNGFAVYASAMGGAIVTEGYKALAVYFSAMAEGIYDIGSQIAEWIKKNPRSLIAPIM